MGRKRKTTSQLPARRPQTRGWSLCIVSSAVVVAGFLIVLLRELWVSFLLLHPRVPVDIPSPVSHRYRPITVPFELPPIRNFPKHPVQEVDSEKLNAVTEAFEKSWSAYRRNAWGKDEYHPLSKSGSNLLLRDDSPIGYTIVDALDSLIIMGLNDQYIEARNWIRDVLSWDIDGRLNVFETTIRIMGGLLSASSLILDPPGNMLSPSLEDSELFLRRAKELADRLLPAFDTPTGIPKREINLLTGESFFDTDNGNSSSLAEATTVQLEFKYLAQRTRNYTYWEIAERPMRVARRATEALGLGILPIFLDPVRGRFYLSEFRLGSRGDSYYEYLVKQYLLTNRTEQVFRDMYEFAFDDIKSKMLMSNPGVSPPLVHTLEIYPNKLSGMSPSWAARTKQDHLVCFLGGTMLLSATEFENGTLYPPKESYSPTEAAYEDWRVGHELIRSCMNTYTESATGLGAEIVFFKADHSTAASGRPWNIKR